MVMYDHLITLDLEGAHLWTGQFDFWKILFVIVRYATSAKALLSMLDLWYTSIYVSGRLSALTIPALMLYSRKSCDAHVTRHALIQL